jgi:sugar lactone lactonase YvrE
MKTAPHTMHLLLSGAVVVLLTGCNAGDPVSTGGVGDGGTSTGDTGTLAVLAGIPSGVGSADGTGAAARFNTPNGVAADGAGNLFVADFDNHTIRKITPAGVVTTFAGTAGLSGSADGTGAAARFFYPSAVAVDGAGNVFVADSAIRRITPAGVVTTFAGTAGLSGSADGTGAAAGMAVDRSGNLFVADNLNHTIRKITPSGVVTTFAGKAGVSGSADGTGAAARFNSPIGVTVDQAGNVFVADSENRIIRKITPAGIVTTFAGAAGSSGDADGTGAAARFRVPSGLAADGSDNLFVGDDYNYTIRKITPAGVVTTFAGTAGLSGIADGTGAAARFKSPLGITVDRAGNVFVADRWNFTIRKITPAGVVTTFAGAASWPGSADGTGAAASFFYPTGVAVDGWGNLFVADNFNHTIRKITPAGVVTTFAGTAGSAGSADGTGAAARFLNPSGVAVDVSGNLFVTDTYNQTIRVITPTGVVTTLAGTVGSLGSADGTGAAAKFNYPRAAAVDGAGNVFVADTSNNTIRKITPAGVVTTFAGTAGAKGSADGTGAAANFGFPTAVAVDASDNVFVADSGNNTIRQITPAGVVTTLAGTPGLFGSADGTGAAARFSNPYGVTVDPAGNVLVADNGNNAIRKVTPAGVVTTIVGRASATYVGNLPGPLPASLVGPTAVAVNPSTGSVYITLSEAVMVASW